jgi:hypothetical protein
VYAVAVKEAATESRSTRRHHPEDRAAWLTFLRFDARSLSGTKLVTSDVNEG